MWDAGGLLPPGCKAQLEPGPPAQEALDRGGGSPPCLPFAAATAPIDCNQPNGVCKSRRRLRCLRSSENRPGCCSQHGRAAASLLPADPPTQRSLSLSCRCASRAERSWRGSERCPCGGASSCSCGCSWSPCWLGRPATDGPWARRCVFAAWWPSRVPPSCPTCGWTATAAPADR